MKIIVATAATKKQLSNAELVFGKTGEKVVTGLEALNKVFKHSNITNFLDFLRSSEEAVEKWAASKSGVTAIENLKIAGTAKSIEKVLAAVSSLKAIPRQDKGVIIPKDKMLDGPKPRATSRLKSRTGSQAQVMKGLSSAHAKIVKTLLAADLPIVETLPPKGPTEEFLITLAENKKGGGLSVVVNPEGVMFTYFSWTGKGWTRKRHSTLESLVKELKKLLEKFEANS